MWMRTSQMTRNAVLAVAFANVLPVVAQEERGDTLSSVKLDEVVVEGNQQTLAAAVSTYYPTSSQKTASQSGIDLLNRMAIPQLAIGGAASVTTVSRQPVKVFIDWLPATSDDLKNMRTTDVKKVEYYDFPSDPRFLGNAHVVNFIMRKYEYGGYLKVSGTELFVANDGQLNLFGKFQFRRITFDLGLGASYSKSRHDYTENSETYRLPQNDGANKTFLRTESVFSADKRNKLFWPTLKMVYSTDKVTISNIIGGVFDHTPVNTMSGNVSINPGTSGTSDFYKSGSARENSLSYTGNWNFILGERNTLNFSAVYAYTHSRQSSLYREGPSEFPNQAKDDSHASRARLQFNHSFGRSGDLNVFCQGLLYSSSTFYSGTADMHDRLTTFRLGPGVGYSLSRDKSYIYLGLGFNYDHSKYGENTEQSAEPWADASFQYSFNNKNRVSFFFHYMTSVPQSSYRSEAVIQSNPLMSYTGNPNLEPYKSFDYGVTYTCMPGKHFSFSVYAYAWSVKDRYAFVYSPTTCGILRTIGQPMGGYTSLTSGAYGRVKLFQNRLQIAGQVEVPFCHNGAPFDTDKASVDYDLEAYWYFGAWNIGARYLSAQHSAGDAVNGLWVRRRANCHVSLGWGNSSWNVSAQVSNPFSWNWENSSTEMHSRYFDRRQTVYGTDSHCYVKLGVTYVFGFGKHLTRDKEASRQKGAGSAILE